MKRFFTLIIAATLMFAGSQLFAQTDVYLNLSGVVPTGNFADGEIDNSGVDWGLLDEDKDGGAGFGFNAGLKFKIATGVNGLGVLVSVDGIYNGLNSELREYFADLIDDGEDNYDDFYLITPKYINIPALAGVNYTYNINQKFGVFAEAGIGPNLRIITKLERYAETNYGKTTSTIEYEPKLSFAYQIGAGIELSKRITLGVNFYNLGDAKVRYEWTTKEKTQYGNNSDSEKETLKRIKPTMVMVRVGIKL